MRRHARAAPTDLCSAFCSLYIAARGLNTSAIHRAAGGSNNATPNPMHSAPAGTTKRDDKAAAQLQRANATPTLDQTSGAVPLNEVERIRAAEAAAKARLALEEQKKSMVDRQVLGGLSSNSLFGDEQEMKKSKEDDFDADPNIQTKDKPLTQRNYENMDVRLNPRPNARANWMSKMVIKDIRRRGRMTREMFLARTERTHTAKSANFKTSVKKLAPLARQVAGKSIDEAIVQMRFSKKKAARYVLKHLLYARNEAIVAKGMGLPQYDADGEIITPQAQSAKTEIPIKYDAESVVQAVVGKIEEPVPVEIDSPIERAPVYLEHPGETPALPTQKADKTLKKGLVAAPTDMYIAQAWVNRGKYMRKAMPRARGRMDIQYLPWTGLSVMLKEEKTRTREKAEKELKTLRKRLNGKIWTQLPDRPITRQTQHVLW